MDMGVDEPGKQGARRAVEHLTAGGRLEAGRFDAGDPAAVHEDDARPGHEVTAVEDPGDANGQHGDLSARPGTGRIVALHGQGRSDSGSDR
jgi:hypothetical protein